MIKIEMKPWKSSNKLYFYILKKKCQNNRVESFLIHSTLSISLCQSLTCTGQTLECVFPAALSRLFSPFCDDPMSSKTKDLLFPSLTSSLQVFWSQNKAKLTDQFSDENGDPTTHKTGRILLKSSLLNFYALNQLTNHVAAIWSSVAWRDWYGGRVNVFLRCLRTEWLESCSKQWVRKASRQSWKDFRAHKIV